MSFNRFHTTAMCSPTRASLLTGRNHHRIGNGQLTELANDWDGYSGIIPKSSALGGFSGGLAAYVRDGMLCYEYNLFEIQRTQIVSKQKLPIGKVEIEVETTYAEPKPAGPLNVTLKVNGAVVARGQVPISAPLLFTANDCLDIGIDRGSPVSLDYFDKAPFAFNGRIDQVKVKYLSGEASSRALQ